MAVNKNGDIDFCWVAYHGKVITLMQALMAADHQATIVQLQIS